MPPLETRALASAASRPPAKGQGGGQPQAPAQTGIGPVPGAGKGNVIGARSPDGPIWRDGAFHADPWENAAEAGPLPDQPVIVSRKRWLADRDALARRGAPLGLRIEPGEALDDIAGDLHGFALIALAFPKFSDGRAFSTARLIRDKHGFAGELRAVGEVLADQIPFMHRVGINAFAVLHEPTRRALAQGRIAAVDLHYQPATRSEPGIGTRPWLRRTAG
jgi:uncharacterized protein (DUF934 family)